MGVITKGIIDKILFDLNRNKGKDVVTIADLWDYFNTLQSLTEGGGGSGDMTKAVYDPANLAAQVTVASINVTVGELLTLLSTSGLKKGQTYKVTNAAGGSWTIYTTAVDTNKISSFSTGLYLGYANYLVAYDGFGDTISTLLDSNGNYVFGISNWPIGLTTGNTVYNSSGIISIADPVNTITLFNRIGSGANLILDDLLFQGNDVDGASSVTATGVDAGTHWIKNSQFKNSSVTITNCVIESCEFIGCNGLTLDGITLTNCRIINYGGLIDDTVDDTYSNSILDYPVFSNFTADLDFSTHYDVGTLKLTLDDNSGHIGIYNMIGSSSNQIQTIKNMPTNGLPVKFVGPFDVYCTFHPAASEEIELDAENLVVYGGAVSTINTGAYIIMMKDTVSGVIRIIKAYAPQA